jgi:hypothetical protein
MPHTHQNKPKGGKTPTPALDPQKGGGAKAGLKGMSFAQASQQLAPQTGPGAKGAQSPTTAKAPTTPAPKGPAAPRQLAIKKATAQKLGKVDSMASAIGAIGGVLDAMAPTAGEGFEGDVEVEIKPPEGVGFYMKLGLSGAVKRMEDGRLEVEGSMSVTAGVAGNAELDTYWFGKYGAEWHAGVKGELGLKATGDNGAHCMRLFGLGVSDWVRSCRGGSYVASKLFGDSYEADTIKTMKPEGSAKESSVEYSAALGLDVGAGLEAGEAGKAEVGAEAGVKATTKVTKGKDGKKNSETEVETFKKIALGLETAAFDVSGEAEMSTVAGQGTKTGLSLDLVPKEVLGGQRVGFLAKALSDAVVPLLAICAKSAPVDAKLRASMAAGMKWIPSQIIAAKMLDSMALKCGYSLKLEYEDGKFKGWSLELTREGEVEVGPVKAAGKTTREVAKGEVEDKPAVVPPVTPPKKAPGKKPAGKKGTP